MSEVKRAKLISFEANRVDSANFGRSVRISVILPESTEDNCPEYNYKDELVAAKRKTNTKKEDGENKKNTVNGLSSFDEEDDSDVKRIAAEMEAKYGVGGNKKRKFRKDDYADIGMGYDESDSFIDNTDGYDEIIPKNVTTLHGGFYINCGALEFKADENLSSNNSSSSEESEEDDEEEEETAPEKLNTRVRVLGSSTESENETTKTNNVERKKHLIKKQKLMMNNTTVMQKAIKKRLFSHDKIKQFKRQKTEEYKKTVRELLKERRDDVVVPIPMEDDKKVEVAPVPLLKENKKPVVLASVDNVIESVINKTVQSKIEQCHNDVAKTIVKTTNSEPHSSNEVVVNNKVDFADVKSVEIVQLPQNLPSDIVDIIENIKKAAANSTEGKVKFFTGHVNTMLLNLESKCKCLGKHSRLKVYEHLAPFVKCRKETLIKRAKNLCVIEEQKKIKSLLERLKVIVSQTMPDLVKNYEKETSLVLQKKFSSHGDEASKSLRMPKRQYLWNEEAKKLLRDIMTLQKKCFLLEGKQKELIETHLSDFLKSDVFTIWPEGWMSVNTLLKYCSNILDIRKKVPVAPKKPTPEPPSTASIVSIVVTTPTNIISSNSAVTITPVTAPTVPKISVLSDEVLFSKANVNKAPAETASAKYVPISNKTDVPDVILIEESTSKEKAIDRDKDHCQIIDLTDQSNRKLLPKPKFYNSPPKQPKPKEPPITFERPSSHVKEEMNCSSALTQIIADSLRQNTSSNISKNNALISDDKKFSNASSSNDFARTFQNSDGDDIMKVMENLKVLQKMSSPIKNSESSNSSPVSVIAYNKSSSHDPNVTGAIQPPQIHRSNSFQDAFQKKFIPDFLKATQNASATTSTSKQQGNGSNSFYKYNNSPSIKNSERYLQNNTNNNYAQQIYNKLKTQQSVEDSLDLLFGNFLNDRNHSRTGNSKSNAPHK